VWRLALGGGAGDAVPVRAWCSRGRTLIAVAGLRRGGFAKPTDAVGRTVGRLRAEKSRHGGGATEGQARVCAYDVADVVDVVPPKGRAFDVPKVEPRARLRRRRGLLGLVRVLVPAAAAAADARHDGSRRARCARRLAEQDRRREMYPSRSTLCTSSCSVVQW